MGRFESLRKKKKNKITGSCQKAFRHIGSKNILVKAAPGASVLPIEYLGHSGKGGAAAGLEEAAVGFLGPSLHLKPASRPQDYLLNRQLSPPRIVSVAVLSSRKQHGYRDALWGEVCREGGFQPPGALDSQIRGKLSEFTFCHQGVSAQQFHFSKSGESSATLLGNKNLNQNQVISSPPFRSC